MLFIFILSMAFYVLAFPPFNFFFLAFVSGAFLCFYLDRFLKNTVNIPYKTLFFRGYIWGVVVMGIGHLWIWELYRFSSVLSIAVLWTLYSLIMGLYIGLFALGYAYFEKWCMPAIWILIEWLRSYGVFGNPNMLIGYSQALNPILRYQAQYGGIFWVGFLVLTINLILLYFFSTSKKNKIKLALGFFLVFILLTVGYMNQKTDQKNHLKSLNVAIIQGNHQQKDKLDHQDWNQIRRDYIQLSMQVSNNPTLILFPETITPGLNLDYPPFVEALNIASKLTQSNILFGTPIFQNHKFYNTLSLMTPAGLSSQVYKKTQLMPFGEYWPMRPFFAKILKAYVPENEYSPCKQNSPIHISSAAIGPALCLESVYPSFLRQMRKNGAHFFCVSVNNAWFFNSSAAERQLHKTIFRAIENHCYLIQAANSGISAVISPSGTIQKQLPLNQQGILQATISVGYPLSFYTKHGDLILYLCIAMLAIGLLKKNIKKMNRLIKSS